MELNVMEYLYQNIPTDWKTNSINPFLENFEVYHLSVFSGSRAQGPPQCFPCYPVVEGFQKTNTFDQFSLEY